MGATDTIVALSSGSLPSGVAIVRLSGPKSQKLLDEMCGDVPVARRLELRSVRRPGNGSVLDRGLVAVFPGPHSFTGEDCAEMHLHGSPAVVRAVIDTLCAAPDVRLALPGEFTRRAFENGRFDLVEVEGLGDLIGAETEAQRQQAMTRMRGDVSEAIEGWRTAIVDLMAEIEAQLDFSDEGDVADADLEAIGTRLNTLRGALEDALAGYMGGRIVREGFRVALAGPPNVGKSSVLNMLSRSDVAIVTDEAGTTRDVREVEIDIDGHLVILIDSAGIRETRSKAEAEGVRRARDVATTSDLVLWLSASDVAEPEEGLHQGDNVVRVANKSDLGETAGELCISAKTGAGFEVLLDVIRTHLEAATPADAGLTISHLRDKEALETCVARLRAAQGRLEELELASEELRQAVTALERLIGRVDVEQVLDRLFAGFCIGK